MLSEEELAKIEQANEILQVICEKLYQAKAKVEAIIAIEEASIHPKQALLSIAREALKLISDGEEDAPEKVL